MPWLKPRQLGLQHLLHEAGSRSRCGRTFRGSDFAITIASLHRPAHGSNPTRDSRAERLRCRCCCSFVVDAAAPRSLAGKRRQLGGKVQLCTGFLRLRLGLVYSSRRDGGGFSRRPGNGKAVEAFHGVREISQDAEDQGVDVALQLYEVVLEVGALLSVSPPRRDPRIDTGG